MRAFRANDVFDYRSEEMKFIKSLFALGMKFIVNSDWSNSMIAAFLEPIG